MKDDVSGVVHHIKVTEKSVNVTLKDLVLKLNERGKFLNLNLILILNII